MANEEPTRPRGEAAWQAAKQEIAKRNEAAYVRGRKARAAREASLRARHAAAERTELANLPHQPAAPGD